MKKAELICISEKSVGFILSFRSTITSNFSAHGFHSKFIGHVLWITKHHLFAQLKKHLSLPSFSFSEELDGFLLSIFTATVFMYSAFTVSKAYNDGTVYFV